MVRRVVEKVESRLTLSVSLLVIIALVAFQLYEPTPYKNVNLVRLERKGPDIEMVATFEKTACNFVKLVAIGGVAGVTDFLPWRDLDGLAENTDRTKGLQTLRLAIQALPKFYDWIEVRTQHDCDGRKVDRVFLRIEPAI